MSPTSTATKAAVVYLCTDDNVIGRQLCASWCEQRAVAEGFTVAELIVDTDLLVSLSQRPGWQRVTELVGSGTVCAVVTLNLTMVADTPKRWHRLVAELTASGAVLMTVRSPLARPVEDEPRGRVHRIALNATATVMAERLACVEPARNALHSAAVGWGISGEALDDLVAVAHELIANAVRHSRPGRLTAELQLSPTGDRVTVEVHDLSSQVPRPITGFGDDFAETGRGLLMVDALTEEWGTAVTGTGKTVWARIALPDRLPTAEISRAVDRPQNHADLAGASRYRRRIASAPRTLVVQPDGFCNVACRYCYLPAKEKRTPMPVRVAEAVARSAVQFATTAAPLDLVWHAGEPLALGVRRFTELTDPFEGLRRAGRLHHYVQTNGTLISDRWCEFFAEREVRVGVSIDGPEDCNAERVDRRGKPIFDQIMKGIARLRTHGIGFSAIAVVTADSIGRPEELLDFFASLGCHSVGFNIEESEGASTRRLTPSFEDAADFWRRTIAWARRNPGLTVREVDRLGSYLRSLRAGGGQRDVLIDPIPTVSSTGDVVLLSPELAGVTAPDYQDFRAGNVIHRPIADMLAAAHRLRYVDEFLTGLDACESTCEFFGFCRGAQAGNRYFENGSFDTTETRYCRVSRQALLVALSDTVREETAA